MAKRSAKAAKFSPFHPLSSNDTVEKDKSTTAKDKPVMSASARVVGQREKINMDELAADIQNDLEELDDLVFDLDSSPTADELPFNEMLSDAAEAGQESITIIHDSVKYLFYRKVIKHCDIEKLTKVDPNNERQQKWLNRFSLNRLVQRIRKRGQIFPALCYKDADGVIWVIDGSRRRYACLLAERDYIMYVCDTPFPPELVRQLSTEANEHLEPSLIERGYCWLEEMEQDGCEQKDIAQRHNQSVTTVNFAIKGASLPRAIVDLYPSPASIGREMIAKKHKLLSELTPEQITAVVTQFEQEVGDISVDAVNLSAANKEAFNRLTTIVEKELNLTNQRKSAELVVNKPFGNKNVCGKFRVTAAGKATLTMTNPNLKAIYEALEALAGQYLSDDDSLLSMIQERVKPQGEE